MLAKNIKVLNLSNSFLILFIILQLNNFIRYGTCANNEKWKCLNPPRTARRLQTFINECQKEVKNRLMTEAHQILMKDTLFVSKGDRSSLMAAKLKDLTSTTSYFYKETQKNSASQRFTYFGVQASSPLLSTLSTASPSTLFQSTTAGSVSKYHKTSGIYHPTLVSYEDKRIAGCLLHCVYARNNAIDKFGWPAIDGLVNFYSEGMSDNSFFLATLRSVNICLRAVTKKYNVNRNKFPLSGQSCDFSFDVFDCISDQITGYCLDHFK